MKLNRPLTKNKWRPVVACSLPVLMALAACSDGNSISDLADDLEAGEDVTLNVSEDEDGNIVIGTDGDGDGAAGGVFVMSNIQEANTIVSYARAADGTLSLVGEFETGGLGGDFDGPEGLDPLISAYALINTPDNEFLMAVNAGSDTITVMQINDDMTLTVTDTIGSNGTGPNSLAYNNGIVYVTNIDADGEFGGEPDQEGSIYGYTFDNGDLTAIPGSLRELDNRPSAVRFSPDGGTLLVTSINSGSNQLASADQNSIVSFTLDENGVASDAITGGATSTLQGNAENRNLPSAIGFEVVDRPDGGTYAVVTEAREFTAAGDPPNFPGLQSGSVSVYQVGGDGSLTGSQLDLVAGQSATRGEGQLTSCWIVFSPDGEYFYVSNAIDATISSFRFTDGSGNIELIQEVAAVGTGPGGNITDGAAAFGVTDGWIDLDISDDGAYIYQLFGLSGAVGVYAVDNGNLTLVEVVSGNLPDNNTQGIVSF